MVVFGVELIRAGGHSRNTSYPIKITVIDRTTQKIAAANETVPQCERRAPPKPLRLIRLGWTAMYNSFFGFRESPFNLSPDPTFLYRSPNHEEALANLIYGVRSH